MPLGTFILAMCGVIPPSSWPFDLALWLLTYKPNGLQLKNMPSVFPDLFMLTIAQYIQRLLWKPTAFLLFVTQDSAEVRARWYEILFPGFEIEDYTGQWHGGGRSRGRIKRGWKRRHGKFSVF